MIIGGDITSALTSFAGLGLALILEGDGAKRVRLGWTDEAAPRLEVNAEGYDDAAIAAAVHRHASGCVEEGSWIQADLEGLPWNGGNAVFSPRIKPAGAPEQWSSLRRQRLEGIDREISKGEAIDLIGALGEPAYWRFADKDMKKPRPDEGASRWEMKTRNRGEDFIANRLRHLAQIVSTRTSEGVGAGLTGQIPIDEAYKGKHSDDSRTATGLTGPRFTDSALAWCALWGISAFPVIHRLRHPSVTAGAAPVGRFTPECLVLPVLVGHFSLARWRALLVSQQLVVAGDPRERSARAWLVSHGARAILSFPLRVSDNSSAPERYLLASRIEVLA